MSGLTNHTKPTLCSVVNDELEDVCCCNVFAFDTYNTPFLQVPEIATLCLSVHFFSHRCQSAGRDANHQKSTLVNEHGIEQNSKGRRGYRLINGIPAVSRVSSM